MAQIALPVLLVGVAYLMSNDKEEDKHDEGFSDLNELKNIQRTRIPYNYLNFGDRPSTMNARVMSAFWAKRDAL